MDVAPLTEDCGRAHGHKKIIEPEHDELRASGLALRYYNVHSDEEPEEQTSFRHRRLRRRKGYAIGSGKGGGVAEFLVQRNDVTGEALLKGDEMTYNEGEGYDDEDDKEVQVSNHLADGQPFDIFDDEQEDLDDSLQYGVSIRLDADDHDTSENLKSEPLEMERAASAISFEPFVMERAASA